MASLWERMMRWIDATLGGSRRRDDLDAEKVEAAIQLIQNAVEEERRERQGARVKVADLAPERQARLAADLARLLRTDKENGE
ncbi:MAG: hypothetical protein IRY83_07525 [Chloroflexi bacterium]|nr:hypothetical protein [Chloroflexota bacterium]